MAAKEKSSSRWLAWLAPLLFLLAAVAAAVPASASMVGALQTRAWEKSSASLESRQSESLQLLNLHQQNDTAGYDDALGSPLAAKSGVSIASGAEGQFGQMQILRTIQRGEKIAGIMEEAKGITFTTGNEVALVKLASGERALVTGGTRGITWSEGEVTRLFGHTHPYGLPPTGPSAFDFQALQQLGQQNSYILEHGQLIKFGVKPGG